MEVIIRLAIVFGIILVFFLWAWLYRRYEIKRSGINAAGSSGAAAGDAAAETVAAIAGAIAVMTDLPEEKLRIVKVTPLDDGSAWRNYSLQRLFAQGQSWEKRK